MKSYNGFSVAQRRKAQVWLNRQWRSGTLTRPSVCQACGQDQGIIDAHAEDYSEPFAAGKTDQFHLCFKCHMMVHCRFSNPDKWRWYKAMVASGIKFEPYYKRDFGRFASELRDATPEIASSDRMNVCSLSEINAG